MKNKQKQTFFSNSKIVLVYLLQIVKRWYFWLGFLPNIVFSILDYYNIPFQIPQFLNIVIPLFGFLVVSFLVYKELYDRHPEDIIPNPKILFSLVEGNEYNFSISSPYESVAAKLATSQLVYGISPENHYEDDILYIKGKPQYWLPKITLKMNLKINNVGNIPFDLLRITFQYNLEDFIPLEFNLDTIDNDLGNIIFPFNVNPSQDEVIQIIATLKPEADLVVTNAQIVASLNQLKKIFKLTLKVDTLNSLGKRKEYFKPLKISFSPLVDALILQLIHFKQDELLRLIYNSE